MFELRIPLWGLLVTCEEVVAVVLELAAAETTIGVYRYIYASLCATIGGSGGHKKLRKLAMLRRTKSQGRHKTRYGSAFPSGLGR